MLLDKQLMCMNFENALLSLSTSQYAEWKSTKMQRYFWRNNFAKKYLKGNGYEIGVQTTNRSTNNANINVKYIDRLSREMLIKTYHLLPEEVPNIHLVMEAERAFQSFLHFLVLLMKQLNRLHIEITLTILYQF